MANGYKINFTNNTITVNYKFAAAMEDCTTAEYEIIKKIKADFPQMKVMIKSGRTKTAATKNKRMTYENMEKYISVYSNSEEILEVFKTVKAMSKLAVSPYKYVLDWFTEQFPNYKNVPTINGNGDLVVTEIKEVPQITLYTKKIA